MGDCPCGEVVALLAEMGASRAALMHEFGSEREWTIDDLRGHIEDEEAILFPLLASTAERLPAPERAFVQSAIELLQAQHAIMERSFLSRGVMPPAEAFMGPHGELENSIVTWWAQEIRETMRRGVLGA